MQRLRRRRYNWIGALVISLFIGWATASWAFEFDEEEDTSALIERSHFDGYQQALQALRDGLPPSELLELTLTEDGAFLTLYIEALAAQPKGQVILLHADGYHPDWPRGIAPLRRGLPEYGWTSLSLSLPVYQQQSRYAQLSLPPRTLPPGPLLMRLDPPVDHQEVGVQTAAAALDDFDQEEEQSAPSERPDPAAYLAEQRRQVELRLQAALAEVGTQGRTVLVLQGQSFFWLQPWLEAGLLPPRAALVLLQVEVPLGADPASMRTTLTGLTRHPLLDLYDPLHAQQQAWAEERRALYRRVGYAQATQLPIHFEFGRRADISDHWIVQRVEGWLRSL